QRYRVSREMPCRRITSFAVTVPVCSCRIARIWSGVWRRLRAVIGSSGLSAGWDPTILAGLQTRGNVNAAGVANRDIYVYREGFYRGMSVSALLLAVSLLVHTRADLCTAYLPETACAGPVELLAAFAIASIATVGFFLRMRRFGHYRLQRSLYRYLLNDTATQSPHA